MLNNEFNLTYYTPVICRIILKKNGLKYNNYNFTLPKKLLKDNEIDEPLPYYRLGSWKTKEIFKSGKIIKYISNTNIQYSKYIPVSVLNKLNLNKHDVLRLRLEKDIIWIEKMENVTIKDIDILQHRFISKIETRKNNYNNETTELSIPLSIIDRSLNKNINVDIDIVINNKRFTNINLKLYKNCTSFHLYITKEIKEECKLETGNYLCSFKDKTLTIEKFLDLNYEKI